MIIIRTLIFLLAGCLAAHGQSGAAATRTGSPAPTGPGMSTPANPPKPDPYKLSPYDVLSLNPKIGAKLDSLLPSGMTASNACSGFKRMGDCGAAIHVSHNLGISFTDLKTRLTGDSAQPLADAIHDLKPDVPARKEARKGENQADRDLWGAIVEG